MQEFIVYVKAKVIALYEVDVSWLNADLANDQPRTKRNWQQYCHKIDKYFSTIDVVVTSWLASKELNKYF